MCLIKPFKNIPYNKSDIRWKVLVCDDKKLLMSLIKHTLWRVDTENKAVIYNEYDKQDINSINFGFHTFISKDNAITFAKHIFGKKVNFQKYIIIAKLQVKEFNTAGYYEYSKSIWLDPYESVIVRSETWKKAKIIKIFNYNGRKDITQRFIS